MLSLGSVLGMATVGCGDDGGGADADTGTEGSGGSDTSSSSPTGSPSTTLPGEDTTGDGSSDGGQTFCETLLCGTSCCEAGQACVLGACAEACDSGVRCGGDWTTCCDAGQACVGGECVAIGAACVDGLACAAGEQCAPVLDACLPVPDPAECVGQPSSGPIELQAEWSFVSDQVASTPVVGDVDGDGAPDVVVGTSGATDPGGQTAEFFGEIVVLAGATGTEKLRVSQDPGAGTFGSYARSSIGLADVDEDGVADIVYVGRPAVAIPPFPNNASRIHAVDGSGQTLWSSHAPDGSPYWIYVRQGGPTFVNLDDDAASEIVFGATILDNDGTVVFDPDSPSNVGGGAFGSNGDFLGGLATAADLTGDGVPEIISGSTAWTVSWNNGGISPSVDVTPLWTYAGPDGFPAIADLDGDGTPEVVLVGDPAPFTDPDGGGPLQRDGQLQILDGATGQLWCGADPTGAACEAGMAQHTQPLALHGGGRGGPPVIADVDGDGRPEIAVAGAIEYSVYDIARPGETIEPAAGDPMPADGALFRRWSSPILDEASQSTGTSAFDFQGDGAAELVFGDECHLRIYDGADGTVLEEIEQPALTYHEYPVVADVDGDGQTELLAVANDTTAATDCAAIAGYTASRGVFSYASADAIWPRTRAAWTMHAHHVTNATATGVGAPWTPWWTSPDLNAFRQNLRDLGALLQADLQVDVSVDLTGCGGGELQVLATVRNLGEQPVPAGVEVSLYRGADANGALVGTESVDVPLGPGDEVTLSWTEADVAGGQDYFAAVEGAVADAALECAGAENAASIADASCASGS
mgnify:CR=1 FL=1